MVDVTLLGPDRAGNAELIAALTDVVNQAYARGEAGLWRDGVQRTTADVVRALAAAGALAVAREHGRVVGCIRVAPVDDATAELGLLAVADDATGSGVGRALVAFAEDLSRQRGFSAMQLQLLVPRATTHPFKQRLDAWYRRLGYRAVRREDFTERYPEPARELVAPCDLVIYERPLAPVA